MFQLQKNKLTHRYYNIAFYVTCVKPFEYTQHEWQNSGRQERVFHISLLCVSDTRLSLLQ